MKFKIGDIVVANKESNLKYGCTNKENEWRGVVTSAEKNYLVPKQYL